MKLVLKKTGLAEIILEDNSKNTHKNPAKRGFCYNKIMRNKIIWPFVAVMIILAFAYGFSFSQKVKTPKTLKIGDVTLNIYVAKTDADREKGLSGKEKLAENEGMLFIFEKEDNYGFWMKDMNFPIDIAWLNKDKRIVFIEKNVLPETYPKVFSSPSQSIFVLETAAGFFENSKIKIGDFAEF